MKRIGIYAGVFDPVHTGHITSALLAIERAKLDQVIFLPERRPRRKTGVEHFAHRVAMLKRAVRPHAKLGVLELVDTSFTIKRTLTHLRRTYPDAQLVFIWGSDSIEHMAAWPGAERLLSTAEFVIIKRHGIATRQIKQTMAAWPKQPVRTHIFASYVSDVSSTGVRHALRRRRPVKGLLASVARYSNQHWLYVAFS